MTPTLMSGNRPISLYFHIPFCTKKCPYCHFYVIPNHPKHRQQLLEGLLLEWEQVRAQIKDFEIVSVYFGGGTPTLFGVEPIKTLLEKIDISNNCEVTIEANPEDVNIELMKGYKDAGINRVSIGVQSLQNDSLEVLERTHNAQKAIDAIWDTHSAGISNISIDLMYELPDQTPESFEKTLKQLNTLPITHLSLYNLTIEPHTAFYKRPLKLPSAEDNFTMHNMAINQIEKSGLKRYEISAFARLGFESRHNVGYWTARPFFGLGPSAFSYFNGKRFRNCANINKYLDALRQDLSPVDFEETLPYPQNVHELLAVELRLLRGVDLKSFNLPEKTKTVLNQLVESNYLVRDGQNLKLSEKGLLFYDTVASEII
ncbi:MAG: radical SAM family heme chaperone HemW [Verrucomicrobia bacterium]|nr:radical SAM family heme chaperone HemW [Verrucomicrobiota bacterium]